MTKVKSFFTKKNIIFILIFTVLGFLALQIPFTSLMGSKANFTLFDFFGPMATGFIGTLPGVIAVFLMQLINFLAHGAKVVDAGTIIRFFPMLFAAWYFGKKSKFHLLIPIIAIAAFTIHPIGRSVWYFSFYWLIPIGCYVARDRSVLARALGATFTAHAVGGALWIYFFNLPKEVWISLIPVVAAERLLFALGIAAMYVAINNLLYILVKQKIVRWPFAINKQYLIFSKII
jgi:hypothetical protein